MMTPLMMVTAEEGSLIETFLIPTQTVATAVSRKYNLTDSLLILFFFFLTLCKKQNMI